MSFFYVIAKRLQVEVHNETSTRDTECKFDLRSPRNLSYCLEIEIEDDRCSRQTVWNPPPDGQGGKPPCTWLQRCTRIPKNTAIVEYNGLLRGGNETDSTNDETNALVPVAVTVVIVILIFSTAIFYVCHKYLANPAKSIYVDANLNGGKIEQESCEMDSVESTDLDLLQNSLSASESKDKNKPLVLLYARGTDSFMNLMVDLRLILETHCNCRVSIFYLLISFVHKLSTLLYNHFEIFIFYDLILIIKINERVAIPKYSILGVFSIISLLKRYKILKLIKKNLPCRPRERQERRCGNNLRRKT